MKKKYEMPVVSVTRFDSENVVTSASELKSKMNSEGYKSVTDVSWSSVFGDQ